MKTAKQNKILWLFILFSFLLHSGLIIAFMHSHVLPDGRIIYHSHFVAHQKDSNEHGTPHHSHTEMNLLHHFITTVVSFLTFCVFLLIFYFLPLLNFSSCYLPGLADQFVRSVFSRRAPPYIPVTA